MKCLISRAWTAISILMLLVGCKARSTSSDEKSIYEYKVFSDGLTVGPISNEQEHVTVVRCPRLVQLETLRKSANGTPATKIKEHMGDCQFLLTDKHETKTPKFFSSDEVLSFKRFCIERCRERNDPRGKAAIEKHDKDSCALNLEYVFSPVANGSYLKENVQTAEDILLACFELYSL